jgi:hypothetical protein
MGLFKAATSLRQLISHFTIKSHHTCKFKDSIHLQSQSWQPSQPHHQTARSPFITTTN